jgi:hypothetical protein
MRNRIVFSSLVSSLVLALALTAGCYSSSGQAPPPSPSPAPAPGATEPSPAPDPGAAAACEPTGCSNTICAEAGKGVMSTCEFKAEYACYSKAKCEKQADGSCGWTRSADFDACIAAGGPK